MKKIFTSVLILISFFSFSQVVNLQWAKSSLYLGSGGSVYEIEADPSGNYYLFGYFMGTQDFDPTLFGTYNMTAGIPFGPYAAYYSDMFVAKFDPSGNLIWAQKIYADDQNTPGDLSVDAFGNIVVSGTGNPCSASSVNYQPRPVIAKLNASTGAIVWKFLITKSPLRMGARGFGKAVTSDASGNVYVTGDIVDTLDFDPGVGISALSSPNFLTSFAFIAKYNSSSTLAWAYTLEGTSGTSSIGESTCLDNLGNIYFSGNFNGITDFDIGPSTYGFASVGIKDGFLLKTTPNGNFIWAKQITCQSGKILTTSVYTDNSNNLYHHGHFFGTVDLDPSPSTYTFNSAGSSFYAAKLDISGNFQWAKLLSNANMTVTASRVDKMGNSYMTGSFAGTQDFDPGPGTYTLSSYGSGDYFILILDSNGNFVWAGNAGDTGFDTGSGICVDGSGNIYSTGSGLGDLDPGPSVYTFYPSYNEFVLKLGLSPLKIKNMDNENKFMVFPNPTSCQFNLVFDKPKEKTEIKIFNSLGQIVLQKNISSTDKISLSISDQPSGIYFVEVNADGEVFRTKVVKE